MSLIKHIELPEDLVESVLKQANWDKVGLDSISESAETQVSEEIILIDDDWNEFIVTEVSEGVYTDEDGNEYILESEETETNEHQCPVCESTLDYEFTDDMLLEHINDVMDIVDAINEEIDSEEEEDENGSDFY